SGKVLVVAFQRLQQFASKVFRSLLALITQSEVSGFALGKVRLRLEFTFCLVQVLLDQCIRPQLQRTLPGTYRLVAVVCAKLGKAKDGIGVGRVWINSNCALRN